MAGGHVFLKQSKITTITSTIKWPAGGEQGQAK